MMGLINISGRVLCGVILLTFALYAYSSGVAEPRSRLDPFYDEMDALLMPSDGSYPGPVGNDEKMEGILLKHFGDLMEPEAQEGMPDDDLVQLWSALSLVVDESQGRLYARKLVEVTQNLYTRDESLWPYLTAPYGKAHAAYRNLISVRLFDLADELHASLPTHIEAFPYGRIIADGLKDRPAILVPDEGGQRLNVQPVSLQQGLVLVGVVHTGCAFSREAMTYLEEHTDEFEPFLPDNVVWVASQALTPNIRYLERWNAQAELIKVHVAWQDEDWPHELNLRSTPRFYLLRDGVVVDRVVGWPNDDAGKALKEMLQRFTADHPDPD